MQRKGFEVIAFVLSGLLRGLLPIGEVKSEDISTSGWMSIKVLWLNCHLATGKGQYKLL